MNEEFTQKELDEFQRRIDSECKIHNWIEQEDEGVFECACCENLLFDSECDLTIELLEKYLLN